MFAPQKKSARAYALAMCAPRTCLPPKKIGSRLRARYVRSAHMFAQKKSDPSNSKKSARASRSLCALRAHVCPPIINRCPLLAPPLFKSCCRHCLSVFGEWKCLGENIKNLKWLTMRCMPSANRAQNNHTIYLVTTRSSSGHLGCGLTFSQLTHEMIAMFNNNSFPDLTDFQHHQSTILM